MSSEFEVQVTAEFEVVPAEAAQAEAAQAEAAQAEAAHVDAALRIAHSSPDRTRARELFERLAELPAGDPERARIVELRFFGGLSVKETAAVLEISEESVLRDWRLARAWLARELSKE